MHCHHVPAGPWQSKRGLDVATTRPFAASINAKWEGRETNEYRFIFGGRRWLRAAADSSSPPLSDVYRSSFISSPGGGCVLVPLGMCPWGRVFQTALNAWWRYLTLDVPWLAPKA